MTFETELQCFQYMIMPFGLKNAPAIFSRIVIVYFKDFIYKFLEVYFDDWTVYGLVKDHIENLKMMLDRCRQFHISLNLKKCIYCSPFGILFGHVVCRNGILMELTKVVITVDQAPPSTVKQLSTILEHMRYYRKFR